MKHPAVGSQDVKKGKNDKIRLQFNAETDLRCWVGNPFYLFAFCLLIILGLYSLGWSGAYDPVRIDFLIFSLFVILIFFGIGYFHRSKLMLIKECAKGRLAWRSLVKATILINIFFVAEFGCNKSIPLLTLFGKANTITITDFVPFPFLHYMAFASSLFLVAMLFSLFLDNRQWRYVLLILINLGPYILLYNRAFFVLCFTQCFFFIVLKVKKFWTSYLASGMILLILAAYGFGFLGYWREGDSRHSLDQLWKTEGHYPSLLSDDLKWVYMYTTIPIANLQHNINVSKPKQVDFIALLCYEILPAKFRLSPFWEKFGLNQRFPKEVMPGTNVWTIFTGPYLYAGWWGIFFMTLLILVLLYVGTWLLLRPSGYSLITLSFLGLFSVFSWYDNMFSFTPMALLLLLGFIFHLYARRLE